MNVKRMYVCVWIVCCVVQAVSGLEASFYGSSYVWVPTEDASSENDIRLHFRTSHPDGLLFLAGGSIDYLTIELQEGALRVSINLGSGEASLGSPPGLIYNDLHWHSVHLTRSESEVWLQIDNITAIDTTTPGRYFELNINRGLYVGGISSSSNEFYGLFPSFRGCMKHLIYGDLDVFPAARADMNPNNVYEVSWAQCGLEFGATSEQPISFIMNSSFAAFPTLSFSQQGRLTFDLRTRSEIGMVVYSSGSLPESDFLALEIIDGGLKLTVNKGSGVIELFVPELVNDGAWHQIEVVITPSNVGLSLDGVRQQRVTPEGATRNLDLQGLLYVGGVSVVARSNAVQKNLASLVGPSSLAGSIIGCVQNFKVNGDLYGLREAMVTKSIQPECMWSFPCTSDPCIQGAMCVEDGYYYYRCICEQTNCFKVGASGKASSSSVSDVIHVQDLVVREGARSLLTRHNIDMLTNFKRFGIRESGIVFKVVNEPENGIITVDVNRKRTTETIFTMMDLLRNKVSYRHDGSEVRDDSIGLELEFVGLGEEVHDIFKEKYGFTLIVHIAPWNDKPQLKLPDDNRLVLVSNTGMVISPELLRAIDRDDPPENLEFTVLYQQGYDIGYFEINDALGQRARITTFTQEDINDGRIKFLHRGTREQQLRIQVSDRKDVSQGVILHIEAMPLQLSRIHNTGLVVPVGSRPAITTRNLTFQTNAPNQDFEVHYEVTNPPYDGEIQRREYSGDWSVVSGFSQEDIDKNRIRYSHYGVEHSRDYFKYKVLCMSHESEEFEFAIQLVVTRVDISRNTGLALTGVREGYISTEMLQAVSSIPYHGPADIVFHLQSLPSHGHLLRVEHREGARRHKKRKITTSFKQEEIDDGEIMYRFSKALNEPIHDAFRFKVLIPGMESEAYAFDLEYAPTEGDTRFTNNGLAGLIEGGSKVLTKQELFMESEDITKFQFSIIENPHHGVLKLIDAISGFTLDYNASSFTTEDISMGKIIYQHDDSETMEDFFNFIVTPILPESQYVIQEIQELSATFEIKIELQNDNSPVRLISRPFRVVANRGRLLTLQDINFQDPDIDYNSDNLEYSFRDLPNGEFLEAGNHSVQTARFKQKDIAAGKVYFRHYGPLMGRGTLWVTDGSSFTSTMFEVKASDPYISVVNNTGLAVDKGSYMTITISNLSVETNLDVDDKNVKFLNRGGPEHGIIKKHGKPRSRFNYHDLKEGAVIYEHDDSDTLEDSIQFVVKIEEIETQVEFNIRILFDSHDLPPQIVNNLVLDVDEGGETIITKENLLFSHPESTPAQMKYSVTKQPKYGKLVLEGSTHRKVRSFTQEDIDQEKLRYRHRDAEKRTDIFEFDVTNSVHSLTGLEFVMEVVPNIIPMEVETFTIAEGGRKTLSLNILKIRSAYYERQDIEYMITKEPEHGHIEDSDQPQQSIAQFTQQQVKDWKVVYIHDDSDTTEDTFAVMAKVRDLHRKSNPHTLTITITPQNDEPPIVAVNRPLEVWTRSTTPLTPTHLRATDQDTPDDQLVYVITTPSNGDVSLGEKPGQNIVNFTQQMLNDGLIVFVHRGDEEGYFNFQVSDGETTARHERFSVTASPLVLSLARHEVLRAYPGIDQPITPHYLTALTNDLNQTRLIIYTLQSKPTNGILAIHLNETHHQEVTSFNQNDIDDGLIFYRHTSGMVGWLQRDAFAFEVATAYAESLSYREFLIVISYEYINEDNKGQLITMTSPVVEEGASINITKANLDLMKLKRRLVASGLETVDVSYNVTALPSHGQLVVDGRNITVGDQFSQRKINKGQVTYVHDHSDSLWDVFHFKISIETSARLAEEEDPSAPLFSNVFNITILPINDQPFQIITKFPSMDLVQGFTKNITQNELFTRDDDTPPEMIRYDIVNTPANGMLVHNSNPDKPIDNFTQDDINKQRILFIHNGEIFSGAFYFRVSDGQFKPVYKVFNININPLTLELTSTNDLHLQQGFASTYLTEETFTIRTNGDVWKVMYNITKPPQYGLLYMHDSPVYQFSHRNIADGEVSYIQEDFTSSSDQLEFIIYDMQNYIHNLKLAVKVMAQVKKGDKPLEAEAGKTVSITTDTIDASELARITNSNPVYSVMDGPRLGTLIKVMSTPSPLGEGVEGRSRRAADSNSDGGGQRDGDTVKDAAFSFSHDDIINQRVQYKANHTHLDGPTNDVFQFILSANNAQPAHGSLELLVLPSSDPPPIPETGGKDEVGDGSEKPKPSDSKPDDKAAAGEPEETLEKKGGGLGRLEIVFIAGGLVLLLIICFVTYKCCQRHLHKRYEKQVAKGAATTVMTQHTFQPYGGDMRGSSVEKRGEPAEYGRAPAGHQGGGDRPHISVTGAAAGSSGNIGDTHQGGSRSPHVPRHYANEPPPPPLVGDLSTQRTASAPMSSDEALSEVSRTVPTCKVTPLLDDEEEDGMYNPELGYYDPSHPHDPNMDPNQPEGQVTFDWERIDPELLQHCRTTNPVLHENKYWV